MDGMLSQDEINALLNGMDLPSENGSAGEHFLRHFSGGMRLRSFCLTVQKKRVL